MTALEIQCNGRAIWDHHYRDQWRDREVANLMARGFASNAVDFDSLLRAIDCLRPYVCNVIFCSSGRNTTLSNVQIAEWVIRKCGPDNTVYWRNYLHSISAANSPLMSPRNPTPQLLLTNGQEGLSRDEIARIREMREMTLSDSEVSEEEGKNPNPWDTVTSAQEGAEY